jgi:hypothetical protein
MTDKTFVQGNNAPDIKATLYLEEDPTTVVDLSGCTVEFLMRKADDRRFTVLANATVVDATAGKVSYSWGTNDLNVIGDYLVMWRVTFPDGKKQTTAIPNTITVRRE